MGSCSNLTRYCLTILFCVSLTSGRFLTSARGRGRPSPKPKGKIFFKDHGDLKTSYEANVNTNVELSCVVGGNPTPTIYWVRNGRRIEQGGLLDNRNDEAYYEDRVDDSGRPLLRLSYTKSVLYLDCVTEEQAGEYECVAKTLEEEIFSRTKLIINNNPEEADPMCIDRVDESLIPARPFLWTTNRIEKSGATVQLICRGEGSPQPRTMWLDNRKNPITEDSSRFSLLSNGDLLVKNINWSFMGTYTCIVDNKIGLRKAKTFLYPTP